MIGGQAGGGLYALHKRIERRAVWRARFLACCGALGYALGCAWGFVSFPFRMREARIDGTVETYFVDREVLALLQANGDPFAFKVGDMVHKAGGDYFFKGWIVSRYRKRGNPNALRYDVENPDGIVHIFAGKQLTAGWPDEYTEKDIP